MAREEKSLSLDELQAITKIQKKYLIGIEEGNYDVMPGKFYARAFIKQYAEAVDLEPEQLFEEFKNEIPVAYEDDLPEQLSRVQSRKTLTDQHSKLMELLPKIVGAVLIVAFLFIIWLVVIKFAGNGDKPAADNGRQTVDFAESDEVKVPEKEKDKDNSEANSNPKDSEEEKEAPIEEELPQELKVADVAGKVTTYTLSNAEKFELKVNAASQGRSWVKISDGSNQTLFQGELKNGESQVFDLTEQSEAYVRAGDSTQTEIFVNDEKLEYELAPDKNVVQDIKIQFVKKGQ